jgi:hypothetical protein
MVFPLADVRLLEIIYSLPSHVFKPKPKARALFRNVCKGILPDNVRLQKKDNGAYALAFFENWTLTKYDELNDYQVKNHLGMLATEEDFLKNGVDDELGKKDRLNIRKEIDLLIELNYAN